MKININILNFNTIVCFFFMILLLILKQKEGAAAFLCAALIFTGLATSIIPDKD